MAGDLFVIDDPRDRKRLKEEEENNADYEISTNNIFIENFADHLAPSHGP